MREPRKAGRLKRTMGWLLSAAILAAFGSPQAQLLRTLPDRLVVAAGQSALSDLPFPLTLSLSKGDVQALSGTEETLTAQAGAAQPDTATVSLLGLLPLKKVAVEVRDDLRLYPGGQAIGVALHTQGVLVVGTSDLTGALSPARQAGLKAGDLITQIGGKPLDDIDALTAQVADTQGKPLPLTVKRGDSELTLTLEPQKDGSTGAYRIGAWVRDSTAGVGTLSFYGEITPGEGARYGALGHAITDADTQQILTVAQGDMMAADIVDVRRGQAGVPGELKGSFLRERRIWGEISRNNGYGIFGAMTDNPAHPLYPEGLPVGGKDGVHTGPATILSTVGAEGMKEYDIEIVEVARQSQPAQRSMVLRVTDERLLSKTGGIVQGMSGSPILQDGRLVGAVTHV